MSYDVRHGAKITVEKTNKTYHTYNDWGLLITNANPVGDPVQYKNFVEIRGRDGKLDLSEALSGRPIYTHRPIKINLLGKRDITDWDDVISTFRNAIMGRICKIVFDYDEAYYWRGRVGVIDFSSVYEFGKFSIDIPEAEPYKYDVISSTDPWLWDPFNFETGIITQIGAVTVDGNESVTLPHGYMATSPVFIVSDMTGDLTVEYKNRTYPLAYGSNAVPSILVNGDDDTTLVFSGHAKVHIQYRGGSL